MEDILVLKQDQVYNARSAKEIHDAALKEGRMLTDEENEKAKDFLAKAASAGEKIAKHEENAKNMAEIAETYTAITATEARVSAPAPISTGAPKAESRIEFKAQRFGKLRAFTGDTQAEAELKAYKSGMWLRANLWGDRVAAQKCAEMGMESRALSEGINTAGGAVVPEELNQTIIDLREQYGVFRQNVRVIPMASDTLNMARRAGGVTAAFYGEGGTIAESDPSWNNVSLVAKKMGVITRYSSEVGEDATINMADTIAAEFAYAFANLEDTIGFNGAGTAAHGSVNGVTTLIEATSGLASHVLAASGTDTFAEVAAVDIAAAFGALPEYAAPNARIYCSRPCFEIVFGRLAQAAGGNTVSSVGDATRFQYNGYPIVISQVLPSATTDISGQAMMLFGDLNLAATMGDRRSIDVSVSPHAYWTTDQIGIRGTQRIDINVHDIGDTTTAGPIVALIAN